MAARKIGATIALDGADKFKKDVSNCSKELTAMKAELGKTKAEYDGQANSLAALTKKQEVLTKTLDVATKKQTAVNKALEAAKKSQDDAAKSVEKQKSAVEKAQKELDDYTKSADKNADGQKELESALAKAQAELVKAEKGYDKAEKAVYDWTTQAAKADTEVYKLNSELQQNGKYLDEAKNSSDGLATSIDEYGKKAKTAADNTGDTVTAIGKLEAAKAVADVMGNLAGKLGELSDAAVNAAKALDDGYDTIITKTGATGEQMAAFKEIADNIYGDMPVEMSDVGAAIGEVNTRFGLQGDELEALSQKFLKFSKINGTDVSGSVDKVQKALTAFGRDASDAGDLLDAMTKAGQDTGVGMDQLASSLVSNAAALQEMGLTLEDSVKFVGQLEKSGVDSSTVMSGLSKALKNATEDGKSVNTALSELQQTILNGNRDMDGLTASYDLFGKKGAEIFNAVKNGSLNFRGLKNSVNDFAGAVDRTYEATLDAWDNWSVATNNLKTAVSDLTTEGLETLTPAINKVTDAAKNLKTGISNLPTPMRKVASVTMLVGGELGKAAPKVIGMASQLSQLKIASELAGKSMGGSGGLASALSKVGGALTSGPVLILGAAAAIGVATAAVINATGVLDGLDSRIGDVSGAADEMSRVLSGASSNLEQAMQDARSSVELSEATFGVASGLIDELDELANKTSRTAEENARMKQIVGELNTEFPTLALTIDDTTGALNMSTQAIRDFVDAAKQSALIDVYNEAIKNGYQAVFDAQTKVYEGQKKLEEVEQIQQGIQKEIDETTARMDANRMMAAQVADQLVNGTYSQDAADRLTMLDDRYSELTAKLADLNDEMTYVNTTHADATSELESFRAEVSAAEEEIGKYDEILGQLQESAAVSGEMVPEGLGEGIKKASESASTEASNMGANTLKAMDRALGVQSPSKYARQSGQYVGQGLVLGELAMRGPVASAAASLASSGNLAPYAAAYIAAAQQAGYMIAQGYASGIIAGRGLVQAAMVSLTGANRTSGAYNGAAAPFNGTTAGGNSLSYTNNMTIYGAKGQDVRQLADLVSQRINRQVNSLRSARA